MKKRLGFTLAEVLITLAIIGVVAALTIPTLMANNQKAQYVTGLKKAYTEFNQALIQISTDKGCVGDLACTGIFANGTTNESLGNELVKYFKVVKKCDANDAGGLEITGCMSDNAAFDYEGVGRGNWYDDPFFYRFITADGMAFKIYNGQNNCANDLSNHVTYNMTQWCGFLSIDVNGLKGPNNVGRDIFYFSITNGKGPLLYPTGGADDGDSGTWQDSDGSFRHCYPGETNGDDCAARVMEEGWQMNY